MKHKNFFMVPNSIFELELKPRELAVYCCLRMGKNTVYKLLKDGAIGSIKQGKKIIVPKVCLVEFLTDTGNYQTPSPTVPNNLWTYEGCCGSVGVAREDKGQLQKKGA